MTDPEPDTAREAEHLPDPDPDAGPETEEIEEQGEPFGDNFA